MTDIPEIPDTPADLLGAGGMRLVHANLSGGVDGLAQILEEMGEKVVHMFQEYAVESIVKAYALGYIEGKIGRPSAIQMAHSLYEGHIVDPNN